MNNLSLHKITSYFLCTLAVCSSVPANTFAEGGEWEDTSKTLRMKNGGSISIISSVGDIEIHTHEREEAYIKQKDGSACVIGGGMKISSSSGDEHISVQSSLSAVFVKVPRQSTVKATTRAGGIRMTSPLQGEVEMSVAGGNIVVGDISGKSIFGTMGGGLKANTLGSGVHAKVAGGNIVIRSVGGNASLHAAGGTIKCDTISGDINAASMGGDIVLQLARGASALKSMGGNVRVKEVLGNLTASAMGGNIIVEGGTAPSYDLNTSGGDIRLTNIRGGVQAKSMGGDVNVDFARTPENNSNIRTVGGDAIITLAGDTKVTIKAVLKTGERRGRLAKLDRTDGFTIKSDFAPSSKNQPDEFTQEMEFQVNGGGTKIVIEVRDGNIILRRR